MNLAWRCRTTITLASAMILLTIASAAGAQPRAMNPWIRAMPPGTPAYAGYIELRNESGKRVVLTGASSDGFAHIMVHETVEQDGIMKMHHVERLMIEPGAQVSLAPNGIHLMLMRPRQQVAEGATFVIVLQFDDGTELPVTFVVKRDQ